MRMLRVWRERRKLLCIVWWSQRVIFTSPFIKNRFYSWIIFLLLIISMNMFLFFLFIKLRIFIFCIISYDTCINAHFFYPFPCFLICIMDIFACTHRFNIYESRQTKHGSWIMYEKGLPFSFKALKYTHKHTHTLKFII